MKILRVVLVLRKERGREKRNLIVLKYVRAVTERMVINYSTAKE